MALIVEDGSGVANADSYVSVADADTYHSNMGNTAWTGEDAAKEVALRKAAAYLDSFYGSRLKGTRVEADQSLLWPRSGMTDAEGFEVDEETIPRSLIRAQCEAALRIISGTDLTPDLERDGAIKRQRSAVGPVEEEIEYEDGASNKTTYGAIDLLMQPYLANGGGSTALLTRA